MMQAGCMQLMRTGMLYCQRILRKVTRTTLRRTLKNMTSTSDLVLLYESIAHSIVILSVTSTNDI